jgi:radical SAM protein with 4Fe4S-binding SPASM domain
LTVEISLYGSKPEIHDPITACPGSFDKALKAFRLLNERSIRTIVKSLMMKRNMGDFQKMKELAREIGSQFLYDPIVIPKIDGSMEPCNNRLGRTELFSLLYPEVKETKTSRDSGEDDLLCSAGLNGFSISPYGDVYPCPGFKESGGNLMTQSVSEIQHSLIFSRIRSISLSELHDCKGCELIRYCNRCPALAWMETGDLLGPSGANCLLADVTKNIIDEKRKHTTGGNKIRQPIYKVGGEEHP